MPYSPENEHMGWDSEQAGETAVFLLWQVIKHATEAQFSAKKEVAREREELQSEKKKEKHVQMLSSVLLSGFVGQVLKRENYIEVFGLLFFLQLLKQSTQLSSVTKNACWDPKI